MRALGESRTGGKPAEPQPSNVFVFFFAAFILRCFLCGVVFSLRRCVFSAALCSCLFVDRVSGKAGPGCPTPTIPPDTAHGSGTSHRAPNNVGIHVMIVIMHFLPNLPSSSARQPPQQRPETRDQDNTNPTCQQQLSILCGSGSDSPTPKRASWHHQNGR